MEGLDEYLDGPTGWAVTDGDAVSPAQVLSRFAKEHKLPKIKAGYFDGVAATAEEVNKIAELPTKPVLIAQILGLIQSPVQGLAGGLHAVMTGLAVAVEEIRKQKEAGGGLSSSSDSADGAPAGEENASEAN